MQLTTSWQTIKTWTWSITGLTVVFTIDAKYSTQDTTNNCSYVQTRLKSQVTYGYGSGTGYNFTLSYATGISGSGIWYFGNETILEGSSGAIQHNADGTLSLYLSSYLYNGYLGLNTTIGETVTLPQIPRASTLNSVSIAIANNGSSVSCTPVITKQTSYYDKLTVKNGSTTVFTKAGVTSGTAFSLSTSDITNLYTAIGTSTSKALTCYLETYTTSAMTTLVGTSNTIGTTVNLPTYTMSISCTYADTGSYTGKYTSTQIVDYLSVPRLTFSYSSSTGSYYGRTPSHSVTYKDSNGTDVTKTSASPITLTSYGKPKDETNFIQLIATDGRKTTLWNLQAQGFTRVQYQLPKVSSAIISRTSPTSSTATVTITGTYYDGTSLKSLSTRAMSLSFTEEGGSARTLTSFTWSETTDSTTHIKSFTATGNITGLNYKKSITYAATLTDRVGKTATLNGTTPQGLPAWNAYTKSDNTNVTNINGALSVGNVIVLYDDGN